MRRIRSILAFGVAGVCLWWVLRSVEVSLVWSLIRHARWSWIGVAGVTILLSLMIRSVRWHTVFGWIQPGVRARDTLRPLYVGYLFNNMLPGKLGEVAKLILITRFTGVGPVKSTIAIAVDRVLDGLGLAIVMGVALGVSGTHNRLLIGAFFAGASVFFLVALAMIWVSRSRWPMSVLSRLGERVYFLRRIKVLDSARADWVAFQTLPRIAGILGLSILNWATEGGVYWSVQHAFSVPGPSTIGILAMGVVSFGGVILSTPGGVGAHEYLATTALRVQGVAASPAVAMAIVTHLILLVPAALMGLGSVITIGWISVTETIKSADPS